MALTGQCATLAGTLEKPALFVSSWDIQHMVCTHSYLSSKLSAILFSGALAVDADLFHEGLIPQLLTSINCTGEEASLLECEGVPFDGVNCATSGVICQGK